MTADLPPEAITAAAKAFHQMGLTVPCPGDREWATACLAAAAPAIRAATAREVLADVIREVRAYTGPGGHVVAGLGFRASLDQLALEKYGIDPDLIGPTS